MNSKPNIAPRIEGLSSISDKYDLILCDVWGVLHNGIKVRAGAVEALQQFRRRGGVVMMVTNAPRPRAGVYQQLANMGVPEGVFDAVVTSGDVTQTLMKQAPNKMFFIGMIGKDKGLFEGLDIDLVDEDEAQAVICTGPFDERAEKATDYIPMLEKFKTRDLPFICANPDKVVEVGDELILCAGGIADEYEKLGGKTLIAGKPFAPIYETAIKEAEALSGKYFEKNKILAIGDGMPTDIKGAQDFGLDVLYVSGGIHAAEYGGAEQPVDEQVQSFLSIQNANPVAYLPRLVG